MSLGSRTSGVDGSSEGGRINTIDLPGALVIYGVALTQSLQAKGLRRPAQPPTTAIPFSRTSSRPAAIPWIVREAGMVGRMPTPWWREPSCLSTFMPVQISR